MVILSLLEAASMVRKLDG